MERELDLKEISDGKRYSASDMVKAGCNDCRGCFECCTGMGSSIILDPYDLYRLMSGLNQSFDGLLMEHIELNVVDGVVEPNLKMLGKEEKCSFLTEEGRCGIHSLRPGFCRMFPLGRIYENGGFQYFLQIHECRAQHKTKVKVQKWMDTPDFKKYEAFIWEWHNFLKEVQEILKGMDDLEMIRNLNLYILNLFYRKPFEENREFYEIFYKRLKDAETAAACYR